MDESVNTTELTFEEKVVLLEKDLPKPLQLFLHSPKRDEVSLTLSKKYSLHVDQAAAFEQAYLYMLLGVNTPEDFVQDLQQAGIGQEKVKGLTNDINELVFIPLQQQELAASEKPKVVIEEQIVPKAQTITVPKIAPAPPVVPAPATVVEAVSVPVSAVASPMIQATEPSLLTVPAPSTESLTPLPKVTEVSKEPIAPLVAQSTPSTQVEKPVIQMGTPPYNLIRPDVLVSVQKPVILHSMKVDMEAMKHPKMPSTLAPISTAPTFHPTQLTPARSFQTASVPYSPPMPPAPIHLTATPVVQELETKQASQPPVIPAPTFSAPLYSPTAPIPILRPQANLVKEFGSDPYREPIS